jgi:tagatose 6-phosphate kinase
VILTVTLNLALDVTYHVPGVAWRAANRVAWVDARGGGKGVNVARVLHALGHETVVTGLAGGPTGEAVRADLAAAGLADALVEIAAESRRTVTVADGGGATGFWEPGPPVSSGEWRGFRAAFGELLRDATAVVLSGSLPEGVPPDAYATLCRDATAAGVPAILDTSGEALTRALEGGPAIVKPNADELAEAARSGAAGAGGPAGAGGAARAGGGALLDAAEGLRRAGAGAVVASLGAEGLVAVTADGRWRARPPEAVGGNPTGAGDAAVAALAAGLVAGTPWPERLADTVALSAAAVHASVAGCFDAAAYARFGGGVRVEALG